MRKKLLGATLLIASAAYFFGTVSAYGRVCAPVGTAVVFVLCRRVRLVRTRE